jgi:TNF receptor-associated factor 4
MSEGFYTYPRGYKMCLRVTANGAQDAVGTYVSFGLYLMHGEFDSQLEWPFRGDVTVQLLNQREDDHHYPRISLRFGATPTVAARVTSEGRAERGLGIAISSSPTVNWTTTLSPTVSI